jgi:hypothetical protein
MTSFRASAGLVPGKETPGTHSVISWAGPRAVYEIKPRLLGRPACSYLVFFFIIISGVGLSPLGTAATSGLLYNPQMINEGDCGAIGGMKIGRGN